MRPGSSWGPDLVGHPRVRQLVALCLESPVSLGLCGLGPLPVPEPLRCLPLCGQDSSAPHSLLLQPFCLVCCWVNITLLLLSRFSRVQLCATPWTAPHQAPPSLGFSRQEHWSGLPFPSPQHNYTTPNAHPCLTWSKFLREKKSDWSLISR